MICRFGRCFRLSVAENRMFPFQVSMFFQVQSITPSFQCQSSSGQQDRIQFLSTNNWNLKSLDTVLSVQIDASVWNWKRCVLLY